MSRARTCAASRKVTFNQEQLLAFLLDRRSYPHRPRSIRLVETHASYVLIARPFVYKVKKPVNYGFLDFSTLEKRRHFCEREVSLNRRLSPDVHLGVVPIFLWKGRLTFDTEGKVVEYAVKMRKLDARYFLSRLLKRNEVGSKELDRIVSALREFYESQKPTDSIVKWGRVERLKISTRENFRQVKDFLGATISAPAFEAIRCYTGDFYRRHAPLFESRVRERRIRDCHGDLHLDHVHLAPGQLSIYDCIEFNDRFRYLDVASDVAFLAMDFDFQGRWDLSLYFTSRMAGSLDDPAMPALMDFYKCYRAFVRGKVESLQTRGSKSHPSRAHARRYFQLALRYAIAGSRPMVVIVMGCVASGKSALAEALGRELGWQVFSSDKTRKELAGVPIHGRGNTAVRRRLYAKAITNRTYGALVRQAVTEVDRKQGVILDATYSRRQHREQLRRKLNERGISYCFVETQAPEAVVKERLARRAGKSRECSDARLEDFETLNRSYERPLELAAAGELVTVRTAKTLESATTAALKCLILPRSEDASGS
jgi:aminoglycoside phosphotransferase family enzyme/predicted kinase